MVEDNLALLLKYPLISCKIRNEEKHYQGLLTVQNQDHELHIIEENRDGNLHFQLKTDFCEEINKIVAKLQSVNILDFLDRIKAVLETQVPRNPLKNQANVYRKVLHEYTEFVQFNIKMKTCKISDDLSTIQTTTMDEGGREHSLKIAIDFAENKIYRPVNLNLPDQSRKDFDKNFAFLTEIYSKFLYAIESLQAFFDAIDDLDRNCCILDPEKPTWRDNHRRIWLDQNLSVMVVMDPLKIGVRPDLKFLGPERLILEYRNKLDQKLDEWTENTDLLEGLLNILEIGSFPSKPQTNQAVLMDTGECSICFSLRFNNKLPEVICGNKSCENFYHADCLYEWLTSVNSKRIFNQIHGQCPNCEKGISCPLPDVDDVT